MREKMFSIPRGKHSSTESLTKVHLNMEDGGCRLMALDGVSEQRSVHHFVIKITNGHKVVIHIVHRVC